MEEKKEYLNEEQHQYTKRKISFLALLIFLIGVSIGGYLIYSGITKPNTKKLPELEAELETKRTELVNRGVTYNAFTKYTDGEAYNLKIITDALDPSFDHCSFDEYKNNSITKEYCNVKNSISEFTSTGKIMLGVFITATTCMISGFVYLITKQRNMLAFQMNETLPVAEEGLEKITPTLGKAGKKIAKDIHNGWNDNNWE